MLKINPDEIKIITKYIYDVSGIALDEKKTYLMETRLDSLVEELGCSSYGELYSKAKADDTKKIERNIIDRITTNETFFFRDSSPFEVFQYKIIPDLIDKRSAKSSGIMPINIRIWCAACSTGQEIYSLGIILKELLPDMKKYRIKLLGTDLSDQAIARASSGKYNKFEVERGLDPIRLRKYFYQDENCWKINDDIRAMVLFKKINLLKSFSNMGKFDIIFCRNVAIYFNLDDRKALFGRIAQILEPDGYLIIGSTESLSGICPQFEPQRHLRSIFYQQK